jgi:hypothetical protein
MHVLEECTYGGRMVCLFLFKSASSADLSGLR